MKALVRNSADAKQVKAAGQKEEIRGEQEVNDLKALMGTPHGRRYIRRVVMGIAGKDRSTVYGDSSTGRGCDPVLEGMRNVGLQVYAEILEHCPDDWALAEKEHRATLREQGFNDERRAKRNDDRNDDDSDE